MSVPVQKKKLPLFAPIQQNALQHFQCLKWNPAWDFGLFKVQNFINKCLEKVATKIALNGGCSWWFTMVKKKHTPPWSLTVRPWKVCCPSQSSSSPINFSGVNWLNFRDVHFSTPSLKGGFFQKRSPWNFSLRRSSLAYEDILGKTINQTSFCFHMSCSKHLRMLVMESHGIPRKKKTKQALSKGEDRVSPQKHMECWPVMLFWGTWLGLLGGSPAGLVSA